MRKLLRVLGLLLVVVVALVAGILVLARFADGPVGILAGGPLRAGDLITGPEPDWSLVRDLPTIEMQLHAPPRSRTTWVLLHEGRMFVPSGYMQSWWGKLWKQWPPEAERDGRAIVRIAGKRHARTLVRITEPALITALTAELSRKYGVAANAEAVTSGVLWLFELAPSKTAPD